MQLLLCAVQLADASRQPDVVETTNAELTNGNGEHVEGDADAHAGGAS